MRQVLAVSRFDFDKLADWIEVVEHLRCGEREDLHIVTTKSIEDEIASYQPQLEPLFQSVTLHTIEVDPQGGWPYGPNVFFWHAARFMAQQDASTPWQLNELDCLPIRGNSYDAVAGGYASCGRPFYGYVGPTPWRDQVTGKITLSRFGKNDRMMSGCAVYPGDIFKRPNFSGKNDSGLMADFMKGQESTDEPWDMHLRSAMMADGVSHTEMIAQHWNTGNYRVENGVLVCDAMDEHEIYQSHPDWERRKCGGKIHPSAMLIHGCKDGSLKQLILNDRIPGFVAVRESVSKSVSTVSLPQDSKVTALEARIDNLASMFGTLMKQLSTENKGSTNTEQPVGEGWPKISKMLELQKWRIEELATSVEMSKEDLTELLNGKNYEVKQGGWIKKAEPVMV